MSQILNDLLGVLCLTSSRFTSVKKVCDSFTKKTYGDTFLSLIPKGLHSSLNSPWLSEHLLKPTKLSDTREWNHCSWAAG